MNGSPRPNAAATRLTAKRLLLSMLLVFLGALGHASTSWGQLPGVNVPLGNRPTVATRDSTDRLPAAQGLSPLEFDDVNLTEDAWWEPAVHKPLRTDSRETAIRLEQLLVEALAYSAQIRVIKEMPLIRETAIVEADAEFDWSAFVESQWVDTSEPVGNQLQTGGPGRFREHDVTASTGVRRRNRAGGEFEIAQQVGHRDNNSVFFIPPNQGNSRLTVSYTQPILRGAGRVFNTSLTVLAQIDAGAAQDDFSAQLQTQLVDVNRAYWELYLERANLLQKKRLYGQAVQILQELERRRDIDALHSQIVRAKAAVASRTADIIRADMSIRNSESRIRALVNSPSLGSTLHNELVPMDPPMRHKVPLDISSSTEIAFRNRPELAQSIKQIRAASVRLNMSQNELLPALNLVLEMYVSGLRGNSNVGASIVDQYRRGEPSYSIGLQYEVPFKNRRAKARYQRRRHELRQLQAQMQTTMESLRLEVEVATREVITSYREMIANFRAMEAEEAEVDYIHERWKLLTGDERSASLLLEDLLDSQERLNVAEFAFLNAQLKYNVSYMAYQKAIGTLLQSERISVDRFCECCLPTIGLHRAAQDMNASADAEEILPGPLQAPAIEPQTSLNHKTELPLTAPGEAAIGAGQTDPRPAFEPNLRRLGGGFGSTDPR